MDVLRRVRAKPLAGAVVILGCAALPVTGCTYARGHAQTAASAQPSHTTPAGQPTAATPTGQAASPAQLKIAARRYLAIALPANQRLEDDFDGLEGPDRNNLAAAKADLRDAAATERLFDWRLLALPLPPPTKAVARQLVNVNQARARLTATAAASTSLRQLRGYERRLTAANAPVEGAVRVIRSQLGLPPPATS
jgi:hypothetical protein